MPNYRRLRHQGAAYFFTVTLANRNATLLVDQIADLRTAYAETIATMPVTCDAMVVLPDHLHAVWTLPRGDSDFSERWRKIKFRFSRRVGRRFPRSDSKHKKRECGIWQRRFWEHVIRDEEDFNRHVEYCWGNPVKHGMVTRAVDWPYSSIHRDIRRGAVDPEWMAQDDAGNFGE
ncbi:Transposase IS200 like protein [Roseovarius albus]|uniref:Transposase IS200 like protein n=1 Tax=Roseovarius albus TaxID=1247867 RepID=A0A1X6YA76_9RHOB|nr:transposase [Roseovarius albus]SLN14579.1 Transposase IS200 like protein [Roseovarius albus]